MLKWKCNRCGVKVRRRLARWTWLEFQTWSFGGIKKWRICGDCCNQGVIV